RVNPQGFDDETSYEYGWSFYTNKQWPGALYAVQRVTKGHALFDLANYYGAICAIKLKRYDEAEDMLDKAVVLPDKLAKSRTLYVKRGQARKLMQQKRVLAKERVDEKDRLKKESEAKKINKYEAPAAPASTEYKLTGLKRVTKAAKVEYAHEQQ